MKKCYILAFWLTLGVCTSASAQGSVSFGPEVGYDLDREAVLIGGQARFGLGLGNFALVLNPYLDYYFLKDITGFDQNLITGGGDLLYQFGVRSVENFLPHFGAGLVVSRYWANSDDDDLDASSTDVGLNLTAGTTFNPNGTIKPVAQAYLTIGEGTAVGVKVAILFSGRGR